MQCDISLHSASKLAFQSLSLAHPCVCFSCSSNALTVPSVPLTFLSSRDKVRNAKHRTNAVRGHPSSLGLCHKTLFSIHLQILPKLTLGSRCLLGEAPRQEKVTSSLRHQSPGERERCGFSFSLQDRRAGDAESLAREGEGQAVHEEGLGNSTAPLTRCGSGHRAPLGFYLKHDKHAGKFSAS